MADKRVSTWRLTEGSMLERSVAAGAVYVTYADYKKLESELAALRDSHASICDLIDRTQSCTSKRSNAEALEEIKRRLEK